MTDASQTPDVRYGKLTRMKIRLVDVQREEFTALLWSFLYFFSLLCGYYVVRPVRDEMGIQSGVQNLPWLFTATFVVMLAAVPVFGWLSARFPRRVLLPSVYGFFIVNLVLFFAAFQFDALKVHTARVFFVWLSVFNLFAVSVFWSFMVDLYTVEQGKRLFGFIAAGGTAGAIAGPALTAALVRTLGPIPLLLVSALMLALAIVCITRLSAWASRGRQFYQGAPAARGAPLGGGIWDGLKEVGTSPYLLGICFYLFCYTALSTLLYLEMARLVADAYHSSQERTHLFATLDLVVNVLTLATQLLLTAQVIKRWGVTFTLALLPIVSIVGFGGLAFFPLLAFVIVFGVIRRAGEFALSRPARETLFTVVTRDQKYKAKNVIDTLVYRGGDALTGWFTAGLRSLGVGLAGVAVTAVPIAVAWAAVAVWLGRRQQRLAAQAAPEVRSEA